MRIKESLIEQPPPILIYQNSRLVIRYDAGPGPNRTTRSIQIQGSQEGFLSLSNAIFFYLNDLQERIPIHELTYVESDIHFTIEEEEALEGIPYGEVLQAGQSEFTWKISESELCKVASEIHSLGYVNSELHLDEGKDTDEISVYCVLI